MISRIIKSKDNMEARSVSYSDLWGRDMSANPLTASGKSVSDDSALKLSTVYGAVRILSDGVATLPIEMTQGAGADATPMRNQPDWIDSPSTQIRKIDFMSQVMMSLLLRGNAYIATARDGAGAVVTMDVLSPDMVSVKAVNGKLIYTIGSGTTAFTQRDILHIRGLMKPGTLVGLSPISYAAETIGLSLAAQEYGAAFFGNGAVPAAIVEVPAQLSKEGVDMLKQSWNSVHQGSSKAGKLAVLTEGAKFNALSVSPDEAQFLQTRSFQVADIARVFAVPPHLLQDASGSTSWGSGLAEQTQNYVTHSLRPWVERIEEAFTWLARSEKYSPNPVHRRYVSLRMDHLLRGDFSARIATYGAALDRGIYNLDEVRAFEGLPPLPDGVGQLHRVPLNTGPAVAAEPEPEPELIPAPAEVVDSEEPDDE